MSKTKYIKVPVADELITIESAFESYEISNIGKDESLKDAFEGGWNARLNQFDEVPDRDDEMREMLERLISWYGKYEDNPEPMCPHQVLCTCKKQDEIIIEAMELLNSIK